MKAKEEAGFRFYQLYDKVYRAEVLWHAYRLCRANGGAAGVDGVTFEQLDAVGVGGWLGELADDLRKKVYRELALVRLSTRTRKLPWAKA
ncbi:hypothetical protein [Elongatibacter sediminis]|uniref:Uncharacterized protein n=1 Tax=Elongatibacter sediminis TaxID=3119006 RepID=A0AAW9RE49_9GAMM